MFVFWNPCARANLHQQKRALKLCSATLDAKWGWKLFLQLGRICFRILLRQRRILASFAKFSQKSLFQLFALQYDRYVNASSSARSRSPPSSTSFFAKTNFTKSFSFSQLLSQNLAKTLLVLADAFGILGNAWIIEELVNNDARLIDFFYYPWVTVRSYCEKRLAKKLCKRAKILRLSQKVFENKISQVVEKAPDLILCLFGFVKTTKFRVLNEFSECVWQRVASLGETTWLGAKRLWLGAKRLGAKRTWGETTCSLFCREKGPGYEFIPSVLRK